ncbi:MAG TPA: PAS domain S-box protein [Burkholderiaceae bacterium]|nr:PAS domain S-box protein [Burkholderiaceae bacterium]
MELSNPSLSAVDFESYRLLVDGVKDYAIYMLDPTGRVLTWNAGAQRIKGYTREEIIGQHFSRFYTAEDKAKGKPEHELAMAATEGQWEDEGWRVRQDGSLFWANVVITRLMKEGRLVGFAKVTRDMTGQKKYRDVLEEAREKCEKLVALRTEELARSEEMFRSAFEQTSVGISYSRLDGYLRQVNQKFCDIVGYSKDQLAALTFIDITHPADRAASLETTRSLLAGEIDSLTLEKRFVHKDGGIVWVTLTASLHRDTRTGKPKQLIAVVEDISQRKRAEQALTEQAALLDLTADAIFTCNPEGRILYWNWGAEHLYGFPSEAALGRLSHELLSTVFPESLEQTLDTLYSKGSWEGKLFHTRQDGNQIAVLARWALKKDEAGNPWRILKSNTDITEQMRVQEELLRSEEQFRLLVEGTRDYAIFLLDREGRIATWNPGAERILGYQKDEIIGVHFSRLYLPKDVEQGEPQQRLAQAIEEKHIEADGWRMSKDGKRFWSTGVMSALRNEGGALRGFVVIMRDNTTQRLADERIYYLANHDPLTGLANRTLFNARLHDALTHAKRDKQMVAIHMLDLDRFKFVNDTLGHDAGDLLLKQVSQRLQTHMRETDTVARLGGDEFVVIQTRLGAPGDAEVFARKLVDAVGEPYRLNAQEAQIGTSIGIAIYPIDATEPMGLLKNSDLALYRAKKRGRYGFVRYSPRLGSTGLSRHSMEEQLRAAVRQKKFELHYQPQIDLRSWSIAGVEALLRWQSGPTPVLPLAQLLELAERTELIIPIGEWVLREACRQNKAWQHAGLPSFPVAANVSLSQLRDAEFTKAVREAFEETGLAPACLALELPRDLWRASDEADSGRLAELNEMGVRLAIDDVGGHFSFLSEASDFRVDILKISQPIVSRLPNSQHDALISAAIIDLAKKLNLKVIAEGVETEDQLAILVEHGCENAQGFLFGAPMPAAAMETFLRETPWARFHQAAKSPGISTDAA